MPVSPPPPVTAGTVSDKTGYVLASNGLAQITAWTVAITGNITGSLSGSVANVTGGINTAVGVITTLDALDTAQDTQHGTTQTELAKVPRRGTTDKYTQTTSASGTATVTIAAP